MCGGPPSLPPYSASNGELMQCTSATMTAGGKLSDVQKYIDFFTLPASSGGVKVAPDDVMLVSFTAPPTPFQTIVGNPSTYMPCDPGVAVDGTRCAVLLQHSCSDPNAMDYFGDPAVRINQVVSAARSSQQTSICESDYTAAFQQLGKSIQSKLAVSCLPAPLVDPSHPRCTVEDVTQAADGSLSNAPIPACSDAAPPCWKLVTNTLCTPQNGQQLTLTVDRGATTPPPNSVATATCDLAQ
jgi:hypothetical protein